LHTKKVAVLENGMDRKPCFPFSTFPLLKLQQSLPYTIPASYRFRRCRKNTLKRKILEAISIYVGERCYLTVFSFNNLSRTFESNTKIWVFLIQFQ
jgi:hypothetical protein